MPRSLKKGPFVDEHLLNKVDAQNEAKSAESISSENVVATYDYRELEDNGRTFCFMALEYVLMRSGCEGWWCASRLHDGVTIGRKQDEKIPVASL